VVPEGRLRAVADFDPEAALGRLHEGQTARMRLRGFPWTEYGTVPATVSKVASEVRDGKVRVELRIDPTTTRIPLAHGLPGSVEVDVERTSPAELLLRSVGHVLGRPVPGRRGPE
jgi:membrane fusion protein (multidrug efflux system)